MPAIHTQVLHDEMAIPLGAFVLVASKSHPGDWHQVTPAHCTCPGFSHRGTCRHLQIAEQATRPAEPVVTDDILRVAHEIEMPTPELAACSRCHRARPLMHGTGLCALCLTALPAD